MYSHTPLHSVSPEPAAASRKRGAAELASGETPLTSQSRGRRGGGGGGGGRSGGGESDARLVTPSQARVFKVKVSREWAVSGGFYGADFGEGEGEEIDEVPP